MRKMCCFVERAEQDLVERVRRCEVAAERLLDDDARACAVQPAVAELLDDRAEQGRRNGEVVRRTLRGAELLAERLERRGVG